LKVGRVKFAVKEIKLVKSGGATTTVEGESAKATQERLYGLAANAPSRCPEEQEEIDDLEEYEEVESILDSAAHLKTLKAEDVASEEIPRCRFCWDTTAHSGNPLFSTCKCSGSVGYIHFECLRGWLDVKK
jgi:RING-variant domain